MSEPVNGSPFHDGGRAWRVDPREIAHMQEADRADILEHELGLDFQAFLSSNTGKMLYYRAREQWVRARDGLVKVDPEDAKAIRVLQNEVRVAEMFLRFCLDPIANGERAANRVREADQAHDDQGY